MKNQEVDGQLEVERNRLGKEVEPVIDAVNSKEVVGVH